ncbi:TIGR03619 family F420-dependent LLM class oxidoreductase [Parahaliea sp. F7430]|uniref:TIGR03619 family F420-dependent LLM class oxidoreductase n=1 Tax=Sediminihaliea albiluteola TaxID=2758564 RepID=A0A7W2TWR5_9GAMM|nr:TIGR03619 family F420-dependent LLM class oxidoreductase [Sediminihaliea albiluteola]MBA6413365.1 TIGR03619 family F420-dependent LLM class oxidoreductase [Sediminihaliea albiluteola]
MSKSQLKIGLASPIVILLPHKKDTWEADAGVDELRQVTLAAEKLGYYSLTCSEHVGIPTEIAAVRGGRYYDPVATFSYMAAITENIRFLTYISVLPYHHPLAVAKRFGTMDKLSKGRLIMGVGVGSLKEEFELLNAEFEERGARYSDAMKAVKASFGRRLPKYHGEHYHFDDFIIDPCADQQDLPLWLGGRTLRSLRRAVEDGDGWAPFALSLEQVSEMLQKTQQTELWQQRQKPFEVSLSLEVTEDLTKGEGIDAVKGRIEASLKAGASHLSVSAASHSLQHYVDQITEFKEKVMPEFISA